MSYLNLFILGVRPNNIVDLLTPVSLASWTMVEGCFTGSGLNLSSQSFSLKELELLVEALY